MTCRDGVICLAFIALAVVVAQPQPAKKRRDRSGALDRCPVRPSLDANLGRSPGKCADIIVVAGDPLGNITEPERVGS